MTTVRVLTIIPTYNEIETLESIVKRVRSAVPDVDILIADDNSPDGTGKLADEIAEHDSQVFVLHRPGKQGLGAAYLAGFAWGKERGYDVLIELDADGSHQPEQLPRMLRAIERGADAVIGSRWVPGGEVKNWPASRKVLSKAGSFVSRFFLGLNLKDITAGMRAYKAEILTDELLGSIESVGYGFQIDMTFQIALAGHKIVEVPVTFIDRELGESKMSGNIIVEALLNVVKWGLKARAKKLASLLRG